MKTKEELNAIRNEVETLGRKLAELSEDELAQVSGGVLPHRPRHSESDLELPARKDLFARESEHPGWSFLTE